MYMNTFTYIYMYRYTYIRTHIRVHTIIIHTHNPADTHVDMIHAHASLAQIHTHLHTHLFAYLYIICGADWSSRMMSNLTNMLCVAVRCSVLQFIAVCCSKKCGAVLKSKMKSHVQHMNESRHTFERVTSHIKRKKESCRT